MSQRPALNELGPVFLSCVAASDAIVAGKCTKFGWGKMPMKKLALATAMALVLGTSAKADIFDFAAIYGGATIEPPLHMPLGTVDMRTGYNVGGVLGWNITPEISAGVDLMYTKSHFDVGNLGRLQTFSVMANGYYNFDIGSKWRPFVGLGAGMVQVNDTINFFGTSSDSAWVFGWQAEAGVTIPVADKIGMVIAYKYQSAQDADLFGVSGSQEYKSHNISAGFVFAL